MRWMHGLRRQAVAATLLALVFGAPRIGLATGSGVPTAFDQFIATWPTAQGGSGSTIVNGTTIANTTLVCPVASSPCVSNPITGLQQARFFACYVDYKNKTATPTVDVVVEEGINAYVNPTSIIWNNYAHAVQEVNPTTPKQDWWKFSVYNGSNATSALSAAVATGGTTTPASAASIGGFHGDRLRFSVNVSGALSDITLQIYCMYSGE